MRLLVPAGFRTTRPPSWDRTGQVRRFVLVRAGARRIARLHRTCTFATSVWRINLLRRCRARRADHPQGPLGGPRCRSPPTPCALARSALMRTTITDRDHLTRQNARLLANLGTAHRSAPAAGGPALRKRSPQGSRQTCPDVLAFLPPPMSDPRPTPGRVDETYEAIASRRLSIARSVAARSQRTRGARSTKKILARRDPHRASTAHSIVTHRRLRRLWPPRPGSGIALQTSDAVGGRQ